MIAFIVKAEAVARNTFNRWWRPAGIAGLLGGYFVNGIYLPLVTLKPPSLAELGALTSAIVAAFAVREVGKRWGTAA